jgi:TPP-dependent pyruvate/acetoin dehydrogenase alpha subunit
MAATAVSVGVDRELARRLYATMTLAAAVDARLRRGLASGEFATTIWPARGQEAVAAGFGAALRTDDRLVTTYRGIHDLVAKGVPLRELIGEILGFTVGASRGKGGTMHITCPESGVMLTTGIVGAGVPVAVGLALAARQEGSDRVVAVSFGDGATNTGSFHEGMNLAATWGLPVVFICQNNQFAEMTPIAHTMKIERVSERAPAYAMPGHTVDGNDPEAVYAAVAEAVHLARAGGGPTLLECVTFRFEGHFFGDPQKYVAPEDLAARRADDPIPRYRQRLLDGGLFDEAALAEIDATATREVEAALSDVLASPVPGPDDLDHDLFVDLRGIPA